MNFALRRYFFAFRRKSGVVMPHSRNPLKTVITPNAENPRKTQLWMLSRVWKSRM